MDMDNGINLLDDSLEESLVNILQENEGEFISMNEEIITRIKDTVGDFNCKGWDRAMKNGDYTAMAYVGGNNVKD